MPQEALLVEDRRITRSKAALREAFIELMDEQGLENFSVNELCTRAGLNRGTFYNHFKDKEDLLRCYEDEVLQGLERLQTELKTVTLMSLWQYKVSKKPFPGLVHLFDYLAQESDFLRVVMSPQGDALFMRRLRDMVCNEFVLGLLHDQYRTNPTPFVNYYVAYYASAFMGVIERWIANGMPESSEEMALIAMRLLFIKTGESIEL